MCQNNLICRYVGTVDPGFAPKYSLTTGSFLSDIGLNKDFFVVGRLCSQLQITAVVFDHYIFENERSAPNVDVRICILPDIKFHLMNCLVLAIAFCAQRKIIGLRLRTADNPLTSTSSRRFIISYELDNDVAVLTQTFRVGIQIGF
ncbi:hypothetical protein [uncultured Sutterella sp.]|uniref:hypothetical protein n=1 Tax=uncultured Sutterella sp. TaxID=286133 RepID=UPI00262E4D09|nr:hypothetical protein [uncultured Sutterella sp.]